MKIVLTWALIFFTFFSTAAQRAFASTADDDTRIGELKAQIASLSPGTSLKVKLADRRQIQGELVAHSGEGFELHSSGRREVRFSEVSSIEAKDRQVAAGGTQSGQRSHHVHFLVKAVVIVAVVLGLTVALVTLDK